MCRGCVKGVSRVFRADSRRFQEGLYEGLFKDVSRVFRACFKRISRVFQGCFKDVSREFQGCSKLVLRVFEVSFKGV